MSKVITVGKIKIGGRAPMVLIAGPCVIESRRSALHSAMTIKKIASRLNVPFVFKASYDKANRTSVKSFRGPGITEGLEILQEVKERIKVPVLSDVHRIEEIDAAVKVLDILQIPAFLCRQTDLLIAAGNTHKVINIKKGQFLAPLDMNQAVKKIEYTGNHKILLTERGTSFGYNNLVSDFRSIAIMQSTGYPVVYDATHSVQKPGGLGSASGGNSEFIPLLSRCAAAAGCNAVFMEVHSNPKRALSDGPNMLAINKLEKLLVELKSIDRIAKKYSTRSSS